MSSALGPMVTAMAVQFGPHFAKNIAPLKQYFSADRGWEISGSRWGMFQSAVSLPCALFPWWVGRSVDSKIPARIALAAALLITCIGQLVFIIATKDHLFYFAMMGRVIFGIGEGLTSSIPSYIAVRYLPNHTMFAIGLTQSFHALAVALSKASLAPVANFCHSYVWALVLSLMACGASFLVGSVLVPVRDLPSGKFSFSNQGKRKKQQKIK